MAKAAGNSDSPDRQLPRQSSTLLNCRLQSRQASRWLRYPHSGSSA